MIEDRNERSYTTHDVDGKTVRCVKWWWNTNGLDTNFDEHIKLLTQIRDAIPEASRESASIEYDTSVLYDQATCDLVVEWCRPLTAEEEAADKAESERKRAGEQQTALNQLNYLLNKFPELKSGIRDTL